MEAGDASSAGGLIGLLAFVGLIFGLAILGEALRRRFEEDENGFKQADVRVDYKNATIRLGMTTIPVSQVRGISSEWEELHRDTVVRRKKSKAALIITTSSMKKPRHEVRFLYIGARQAAETMAQRLQTAIEKAGGPSFA